MKPRTIQQYGILCPPNMCAKGTWIEAEEACTDYGQFKRRARAIHEKTNELVDCRADIPDTYFSIPATTKTEHGFITSRDGGELVFIPHTEQTQTPAEFRKATKKAYK